MTVEFELKEKEYCGIIYDETKLYCWVVYFLSDESIDGMQRTRINKEYCKIIENDNHLNLLKNAVLTLKSIKYDFPSENLFNREFPFSIEDCWDIYENEYNAQEFLDLVFYRHPNYFTKYKFYFL